MKKAFVTGGSGFVGRNLIRRLRRDGVVVAALARSEAAANTVAALGAVPVRGDLLEPASMAAGMVACDVVFHAAATVDEWGPKPWFWQGNVDGTTAALQAASQACVPCFVHVGTEAVYADGRSSLLDLNDARPVPAQPLPRYPATKAEAERRVLAANAPDLRCVSVRPRLIWGNDDTSVLPRLIAAVRSGRFVWPDHGRALTSTCHVDNVCEALLLAAARGQGGETYLVSDGPPTTYREFLGALLASRGVSPRDKSLPLFVVDRFARIAEFVWDRFGLPGVPPAHRMMIELGAKPVTLDDRKAREQLGYVPVISREQGLAQLAD